MANYLYNGMELPALPEWDKTKYPYAFVYLTRSIGSIKHMDLYLMSEIVYKTLTASDGYTGDYPYVLVTRELHCRNSYYSGWQGWGDIKEYPYDTGVMSLFNVGYDDEYKWANFDILNEDGTVSLAASNPIDAETGEVIRDYEIVEFTLTARDLYRKINGKPTKLTLYKKLGGKLVALDEHTKEVKT